MDLITQPWAWYVAGPIIALTMFLLIWFGRSFGMSSNLRTICAVGGGAACSDFFKFDWKSQRWNLVVAFGAILGGFIAFQYLTPDDSVAISSATVAELKALGINDPGGSYLPDEIFGASAASSPIGIILLLVAGVLVGFGARYAGGCTSGHAISGLSNLQWPSLVAVIGFFLGGLLMTHLLLPTLLSL